MLRLRFPSPPLFGPPTVCMERVPFPLGRTAMTDGTAAGATAGTTPLDGTPGTMDGTAGTTMAMDGTVIPMVLPVPGLQLTMVDTRL